MTRPPRCLHPVGAAPPRVPAVRQTDRFPVCGRGDSHEVQPTLAIRPLSFRQVCAYIVQHHRHHKPPRGGKVFLGVVDVADERLCGVAVVGRPSARAYDDGWTFEVTRTCTDGTPNANSCLYGAARKVAFAMGYRRGASYIEAAEGGTSLKAAGWWKRKDLPARKSWAESSQMLRHIRDPLGSGGVPRELWVCGDWPTGAVVACGGSQPCR